MRRYRWLTVFSLAALVLAGAVLNAGRPAPVVPVSRDTRQQPPPQRPSFSSSTVLVPVIVRAIDNRTQKPITDLQQDDFTVFEDGVPQPIRHFQKNSYGADAAPPAAAPAARPAIRQAAVGLVPQNNRIFLFVLGRGRLQEPSKALDALQRFLREQMLPSDQVAVLAYDRATDFTTDKELVAKFIERFKKDHYQIDMEVRLALETDLSGIYGSKALPKKTRERIEAMFAGSGLTASRTLAKGDNASTARAAADADKQIDRAISTELQRQNEKLEEFDKVNSPVQQPPWGGSWTTLDEIQTPMFASLGLDDFVQVTARSLQDLGTCYSAVEYLRHLEGDKHLVFVTERGLNLPRLEDDMDLAKAANDARVAIDTFQVGGLMGQQGGVWTDQSQQTFAFKGLRMIAEQTGGVSSIAEDGMVAVNRINEVSRSEYLLGFYPGKPLAGGDFRRIEVKTRRPGVTLLYRRGYFARTEVASYNRREAITRERMVAAAGFRRTVDDIKVKLNASQGRGESGSNEVTVKGSIDLSRLFLPIVEGNRKAQIDILAVCFNDKDAAIGQFYQRADVDITPEMFEKFGKSGLPYNLVFQASPATRRVRIIVYDYRADLIGSSDSRLF